MEMSGSDSLERSTDEVLRVRSAALVGEPGGGLAALDAWRRALLDAVETRLVGSAAVEAAVDATPRDEVAIGNRLVVGWTLPAGAARSSSWRGVLTGLEAELALADGRFAAPLRGVPRRECRSGRQGFRVQSREWGRDLCGPGPAGRDRVAPTRATRDLKAALAEPLGAYKELVTTAA